MRALEAALAAGTSWRRALGRLPTMGLDLTPIQEAMWREHAGGYLALRGPRRHSPAEGRDPAEHRAAPRVLGKFHLCLADLWEMAARIRGSEGSAPRVRTELEAAAAAAPDEPLPQLRLAEVEPDLDVRRKRAGGPGPDIPRSAEARVFLARVLRDRRRPVEGRRETALAAAPPLRTTSTRSPRTPSRRLRSGNAAGALKSVARAREARALEPGGLRRPGAGPQRNRPLRGGGRHAVQRALDVLPDNPSGRRPGARPASASASPGRARAPATDSEGCRVQPPMRALADTVRSLPTGTRGSRTRSPNRGTAFTAEERFKLRLDGLLPPVVETLEQQCAVPTRPIAGRSTTSSGHIYLRALQDNNETLCYAVARPPPHGDGPGGLHAGGGPGVRAVLADSTAARAGSSSPTPWPTASSCSSRNRPRRGGRR
jgi:hypothetical protein